MKVTGTTQLFPIIGHPVSGVFSPPAFNTEFENRGLDVAMVPIDILPSALEAFWILLRNTPNIAGCSVTYPHKQAAHAAVDELTPRAQRLGAVNTVRKQGGRLIGEATDGLAMCSAIKSIGLPIAGRSAFVMGAGGGAGAAIVDELCANGVRRLTISEIDSVRHSALLSLLKKHWPEVEISQEKKTNDILINATLLGKNPLDECPFSDTAIKAAFAIGDVVTFNLATQLISKSKALGVCSISGERMGKGQLAAQLSFLGY
jgi:shikimate dehydrogenase